MTTKTHCRCQLAKPALDISVGYDRSTLLFEIVTEKYKKISNMLTDITYLLIQLDVRGNCFLKFNSLFTEVLESVFLKSYVSLSFSYDA